MPKRRGDVEISPRGLGILYENLSQEKCQNLKMAAIGRNMSFLHC